MSIRPARPDDWTRIQALNRQIFEHELQTEPSSNAAFPDTAEAIDYFQKASAGSAPYAAFVCEVEGHVIGYAIGKLIPAAELSHRVGIKQAQLHTLGVDRLHRRKGIGKQLVAACRQWAVANGANRLKVVAYAGNKEARSLYREAGFRELEVVHEIQI